MRCAVLFFAWFSASATAATVSVTFRGQVTSSSGYGAYYSLEGHFIPFLYPLAGDAISFSYTFDTNYLPTAPGSGSYVGANPGPVSSLSIIAPHFGWGRAPYQSQVHFSDGGGPGGGDSYGMSAREIGIEELTVGVQLSDADGGLFSGNSFVPSFDFSLCESATGSISYDVFATHAVIGGFDLTFSITDATFTPLPSAAGLGLLGVCAAGLRRARPMRR